MNNDAEESLIDSVLAPEEEEEIEEPQTGSSGQVIAVNIPLTPGMETSLCRRGRRRFRELQVNNPNAKIRFDRRKKVLRVVAAPASIESVRRQLESLGGARMTVPAALWCELMRTRTQEDGSKSLLLQLQQQTGCRIHIERGHHEVRIFGPDEESEAAEAVIEGMADLFAEAQVPLTSGASISPSALQCIAETCEVTLTLQKGSVMVYGYKQQVNNAVEELETELADNDFVDTEDEFDAAEKSGVGSSGLSSWRSEASASASTSLTIDHFSRMTSAASVQSEATAACITVTSCTGTEPSSGVSTMPLQCFSSMPAPPSPTSPVPSWQSEGEPPVAAVRGATSMPLQCFASAPSLSPAMQQGQPRAGSSMPVQTFLAPMSGLLPVMIPALPQGAPAGHACACQAVLVIPAFATTPSQGSC
eukprot:CAMPEP_0178411706 /NCGR_PEP_ID=MMETSP0689_2-20121128/21631_1 /TAXON_ID=160604 /ORGANISM="Amphidinium massartii, Strain CS-259" /LENGTH=418 /DNA_ID=CAMNT_0020032917 /DNA_START=79 /DNA_END=1335 /DNA_ORIENTATION=+